MGDLIINTVIEAYGITHEAFCSKSRFKPIPEARRMATLLMHFAKIKPISIARKLRVHKSYIGQAIDKMVYELHLYDEVTQKYINIKSIMLEKLINKRDKLEQWLKDHTDAPFKDIYDKTKELADIQEQINNIN